MVAILITGVFGERRTLPASKSLRCRYPSSKTRKIIPESRRSKSVRDRGVGGSNPLAPTIFLRKFAKFSLPSHSVPMSK
jgi:hypothetical protein